MKKALASVAIGVIGALGVYGCTGQATSEDAGKPDEFDQRTEETVPDRDLDGVEETPTAGQWPAFAEDMAWEAFAEGAGDAAVLFDRDCVLGVIEEHFPDWTTVRYEESIASEIAAKCA